MNLQDLANRTAERFEKLERTVREIATGSPLQSSSVTKGRIRVIGGLLRIDEGGRVEIVGTLEIDGTTTVTGTFKVTGPWSLDGDGTISGDVTISGTVALTGDMNVTGDINVTGSGRVKVGNMTLDPSSNGGSMKFGSGPEVYANGAELSLYSGLGSFITLNAAEAKINGPGARWLEVNGSGFKLVNLPTKTAASTGLPVGALHADSSGNLFRIVT